jgi:hypothetical protein
VIATKKAARTATIEGDGIVRAVIATYGVVDFDLDLVERGAIDLSRPVAISTWNHGSWQTSQPPIGRGRLSVAGDEVVVTAEFFMQTQAGAETFYVVKSLAEVGLGEWSWSLRDVERRPDRVNGQTISRISRVKVHEVSPVMVGASIGTRTLSAKDAAVIEQARRHISALREREASRAAAVLATSARLLGK